MTDTEEGLTLGTARDTIQRAMTDLLAMPDEVLERRWHWPGHGETDIRYGLYRILEDIEAADGRLAGLRLAPSAAETSIAPTTTAAWELGGLLAGLSTSDLDSEPGGAEWTVRRTLAHMIWVQDAYATTTAWWREQRHALGDPALPAHAPVTLDAALGTEERAADGSPDEIRLRLRRAVDDAGQRLRDMTTDELAVGARWSGFAVPIRFRLGRWSSHLREHTVQVDKTLVAIGRQPTEVERIVRLLAGAWGRLEARLWPGSLNAAALGIAVEVAERSAGSAGRLREASRGDASG